MLKADRTLSQEEYLIYRRSLYSPVIVVYIYVHVVSVVLEFSFVSLCFLFIIFFGFLLVSSSI